MNDSFFSLWAGKLGNKSAADRGSADAYYGRGRNPHKIVDNVRIADLTNEEIAAYCSAYDNEYDRKDWGEPEIEWD